MNQAKRQLSVDMSCEEETKKLRTFDENKSIKYIEDLSNELFYEIFDYLDACEIFNTFSNLNIRFKNLLIGTSLPLKIHHFISSEQFFEYHCKRTIIPNKHRIISLHMLNRSQFMTFFTLHFIDSSFYRLQSIILYGIKFIELISLLPNLTTLPHLFSLNIHLDDILNDFNKIYHLIFNLSMLKYNKLSSGKIILQDQLLNTSNEHFTSIEQLIIDHPCTIDGLNNILSHTLKLSRLTCEHLFQLNNTISTEIPLRSFNLTHFSIKMCYLKYNEFETFIKKISSHLRFLSFIPSSDILYLDAERWERLISQYISHLRIFQFEYHDAIYGHFELQPYHSFINRFTSLFWIERQWFLNIQIDINRWPPIEVIYSIHPYRKRWYENYNYESINTSKTFYQLSQLTVRGCHFSECDQWFIDYIRFLSSLAQITCLHIEFNHFSINILIQFLHLLPNIDSLTIISIFSSDIKDLTKEQINNICSISNSNKITKVNIEHIMELNDIYVLINLCPHMEYLQIKCKNIIDLELIIRFILMKKNMNFIPHLYLLCLWISEANDEMVKKLQTIIHIEKLLINYIIKRCDDRIYLQWQRH